MLFSCLVDADFLDTESFMSPERAELREGDRATCQEMLDRLNKHLAEKEKNADDTPVNRRRREVLASCRDKARLAPGFFSLHVPTGGGKTLSSLAFALTHAVAHDKRRVIYAIPFTSIIEQTADVFREALGDLHEALLEHHSNLEPDDPSRSPTARGSPRRTSMRHSSSRPTCSSSSRCSPAGPPGAGSSTAWRRA